MNVNLNQAISYLLEGSIVAFPTETVYGLGGVWSNPEAIQKIYALKKRPADNPLIAHISSLKMAKDLARHLPDSFYELAERYWPGPLTLVVPGKAQPSIALRMPNHSMALELISAVAEPLAAPSANLSGRPSPTCAAHVAADFPNLPILNGGACPLGIESTVISLLGDSPTILRPGSFEIDLPIEQNSHASPGTRYRHYAPAVPLTLYTSLDQLISDESRPSTILSTQDLPLAHIRITPSNLYATLRSLTQPAAVLCITKNLALHDRLIRACQ
ncbi:MAG: threonylcarbamoyl-AMP synthase [Chlamydiales bacterium]|nr:threonylcarbamoyl-AMP synthase [Chlamydiales bacterium]